MLHIEDAHDDDADDSYRDGDIVLIGELFLQEDAAPDDGSCAVGGDNGRRHGKMLPVGNGEYVGGLSDRFADSADQLCAVGFRNKGGFLADHSNEHKDKAYGARREERQLIGDIRRILLEGFQRDAVRKGARCIENTIRDREAQRLP